MRGGAGTIPLTTEERTMEQGLENVRRIYLEGIAGGRAREAVKAYTGHRYTQHSTGVADGAEGFLAFFEPFVARNPKRDIEIVRIFEDGPWVFCSAYQSLNEGAAQWVTMDMFYTDADGLILEHWDTIAAYVVETASGEDMVGGTRAVDTAADAEASKALVLEYTKQVRQQRSLDALSQFVAEDLVQHAAPIAARRAGLAAWPPSDAAGGHEIPLPLSCPGHLVTTQRKGAPGGADSPRSPS